ncbi:MAG TPA: CHAD domain-containing protein [Bacteroidales bacterium]|nr:CHAD domain-containing protein [Bacteroidales bacterium]
MEADYIRLKEIKPELAGYLNDSLELLGNSSFPDDSAVHDIRVLLKKSRATLKLIGSQVITDFSLKDIQSLKEAAAMMSVWRDNTVLRKTLKEIKKDYPGLIDKLKDDPRISSILIKPEHHNGTPETALTSEKIGELIKKSAFRIRFQNTSNIDPNILLKELEGSYLKASDRFLTCRLNAGQKNLHDFRKKSKEFLYQLYFFRPVSTQVKSLEKKLDDMTRNLGKVNDLFELLKSIDPNNPEKSRSSEMDELIVRIREKQDKYLQRIWPVASKVFCPGRKLVNLLGYKILVI